MTPVSNVSSPFSWDTVDSRADRAGSGQDGRRAESSTDARSAPLEQMVRALVVRAHRQDLVRKVGPPSQADRSSAGSAAVERPASIDQPCADRVPVGWREA